MLPYFFFTLGFPASGLFKFFDIPSLDGDVVEARLILPKGTPLHRTEAVVARMERALQQGNKTLSQQESGELVRNIKVTYGQNLDAFEAGPHVATVAVDLLTTEKRNITVAQISADWHRTLGDIPDVLALQFKQPVAVGPVGRPFEIRFLGDNTADLKSASQEGKHWLSGYHGVVDVMDDLRPGKPELDLTLKEGALSLGVDVSTIATQLRAAFKV